MKRLLITTALLEAGAGLALLAWPAALVRMLLGGPLEGPAALLVARIGGAGLLTLGVAAWLASYDAWSRSARGLGRAMILYNFSAALILGIAGLHAAAVGPALWPAVALHAAMTAWCLALASD